MSKKEKRYVLKPKFTLSLIPKRDLVLGFLMLVLGSFCFGYLFMGLFLGFYIWSSAISFPIRIEYIISNENLKTTLFIFSFIGVLLASFFAYQIWFSSFQGKDKYKFKTSFLTHTGKDLIWILSILVLRFITVIMGIVFFNISVELFWVLILGLCVIVLRENNHLKLSFKLSWKYEVGKILLYVCLALITSLVACPHVFDLNDRLKQNTAQYRYGISIPESNHDFGIVGEFSFEFYFFKKDKNLYLTDFKKKEYLLENAGSLMVPPTDLPRAYLYFYKQVYHIDGNATMEDVDKLVSIVDSYTYSSRLNYATVSNKFYADHIYYGSLTGDYNMFGPQKYSNLYFTNSYRLISNGNESHYESGRPFLYSEKNKPPPPPPPFEFHPLNFDTKTTSDIPFVHLHLANDQNYYLDKEVLYPKDFETRMGALFGSDTILIISYDKEVSFESLTKIIDYLWTMKDYKIASYEAKRGISLQMIEERDEDEYREVRKEFSLPIYILSGFYDMKDEIL